MRCIDSVFYVNVSCIVNDNSLHTGVHVNVGIT